MVTGAAPGVMVWVPTMKGIGVVEVEVEVVRGDVFPGCVFPGCVFPGWVVVVVGLLTAGLVVWVETGCPAGDWEDTGFWGEAGSEEDGLWFGEGERFWAEMIEDVGSTDVVGSIDAVGSDEVVVGSDEVVVGSGEAVLVGETVGGLSELSGCGDAVGVVVTTGE
jgi:hypothetical protein